MRKLLYTFMLVSMVGLLVFPSRALACMGMETSQAMMCCTSSEDNEHSCAHEHDDTHTDSNKTDSHCPDASCVCNGVRVANGFLMASFLEFNGPFPLVDQHQFFYSENSLPYVFYTIWTPPKIG